MIPFGKRWASSAMVLIVGCNEVRHPDQNCNCRDRSMTSTNPSTAFDRACYPSPLYPRRWKAGGSPPPHRDQSSASRMAARAARHAMPTTCTVFVVSLWSGDRTNTVPPLDAGSRSMAPSTVRAGSIYPAGVGEPHGRQVRRRILSLALGEGRWTSEVSGVERHNRIAVLVF
jgi:hypothetical protein